MSFVDRRYRDRRGERRRERRPIVARIASQNAAAARLAGTRLCGRDSTPRSLFMATRVRRLLIRARDDRLVSARSRHRCSTRSRARQKSFHFDAAVDRLSRSSCTIFEAHDDRRRYHDRDPPSQMVGDDADDHGNKEIMVTAVNQFSWMRLAASGHRDVRAALKQLADSHPLALASLSSLA